jgi:CTP synthase (UTP-ammonia lyase)
MARRIYGCDEVVEGFCCNYGLNPAFRARFEAGGLILAGSNPDGEIRLVELASHPFFVATLFLPQLSSTPARPHPLMTAYLKAALASAGVKAFE